MSVRRAALDEWDTAEYEWRSVAADGKGMNHSEDVSATRAARNEIALRKYNEKVEDRRRRIKPSLAEWLCECFDENCAQPVKLSMEEYEVVRADARHFLVAPGEEHVSPSVEHVLRREERYWIVEKIGVAAEMSEQSDPRST